VKAAYVGDGGELPKYLSHFAINRERYERQTAAVIREFGRWLQEQNNPGLRVELDKLADEIEATQ
jgi:hypothetical protein